MSHSAENLKRLCHSPLQDWHVAAAVYSSELEEDTDVY